MHCCPAMRRAATLNCPKHKDIYECPDVLVSYSKKLREYGIIVHNGGTASARIAYCPWCGKKLPGSLRDRWFDALDALGIDPWKDEIPRAYQSDAWWKRSRRRGA
jgi:hypothetical protein